MDHPAAWHPDPLGRYEYRYWDGQRWTENVANQGVAGVDGTGLEPQGGPQSGQAWGGQQAAGSQPQAGGWSQPQPQPQSWQQPEQPAEDWRQAPAPQQPQPDAWQQAPAPQQPQPDAWQQPQATAPEQPAPSWEPSPEPGPQPATADWQQPWTAEPAQTEEAPAPAPAAAGIDQAATADDPQDAAHWQQPWTATPSAAAEVPVAISPEEAAEAELHDDQDSPREDTAFGEFPAPTTPEADEDAGTSSWSDEPFVAPAALDEPSRDDTAVLEASAPADVEVAEDPADVGTATADPTEDASTGHWQQPWTADAGDSPAPAAADDLPHWQQPWTST